jgi:hypothetical protein
VPTNRQSYDGDLKDFRQKLKISLEQLQKDATAHPGSKTDILGSLALADQEFQVWASESNRTLIILSDFIEEDSDLNFKIDVRFRTAASSTKLSKQIAKQERFNFRGIHVYLGALRSKEYTGFDKDQRIAIREFWMEYFTSLGSNAEFAMDGTSVSKRVNSDPL